VKKQAVAALVAVLLAAVGVLALVNYANGANDRAFEGAKLVEVLRVRTDVPIHTPAERMSASVELVKIPASAKVDGALTSLDSVKSESTNAPLNKGEQVLASRFSGASETKSSEASLPKGMQEVTISVGDPRIPTGKLKPGDRVGVMTSYPDSEGKGAAGYTNMAAGRVLVTRVSNKLGTGDGTTASLVTLAVDTVAAEKIVNASEFGKVWLTLQGDDADISGRRTISGQDVLK
jgi:pilus assembly protein CpaB